MLMLFIKCISQCLQHLTRIIYIANKIPFKRKTDNLNCNKQFPTGTKYLPNPTLETFTTIKYTCNHTSKIRIKALIQGQLISFQFKCILLYRKHSENDQKHSHIRTEPPVTKSSQRLSRKQCGHVDHGMKGAAAYKTLSDLCI